MKQVPALSVARSLLSERKFIRLEDLISSQPPTWSQSTEWLGIAAEAALGSGKLDLAAERIGLLSSIDPQNDATALLRARWQVAAGDLTAAEHEIGRIVKVANLPPKLMADFHEVQAVILLSKGEHTQALKVLQRVVRTRPASAYAHVLTAYACTSLGRRDEAYDHLSRAYALEPSDPFVLKNFATAESDVGSATRAAELALQAWKLQSNDPELRSAVVMMHTAAPNVSADDLFRVQRETGEVFARARTTYIAGSAARPSKLRLGYFSHHFRAFPLSSFLPHVVQQHDRSKFHVVLLSMGAARDATTSAYERAADAFIDLRHLDDEAAARKIAELNLDLLIDVSGLTAHHRFGVLEYRPARVQVGWLGYLGSCGSGALDFHVTDALANPVGKTEHLYSEKLFRLPQTQYLYCPDEAAPSSSELSLNAEASLRRAPFRFGYFSAPQKTNAEVLNAIGRILTEVPESELVFYVGSQRQRELVKKTLASQFAVKASRIHFLGKLDKALYLRTLADVDVVLDSFPFVGGTTVCDAIYMGTPVVSMWLARSFGGTAASVLRNVELGDLVCLDVEQYVHTAVRLAQAGSRHPELRAELRRRMESSALMNEVKFMAAIEDAYVDMADQGPPPQTPD